MSDWWPEGPINWRYIRNQLAVYVVVIGLLFFWAYAMAEPNKALILAGVVLFFLGLKFLRFYALAGMCAIGIWCLAAPLGMIGQGILAFATYMAITQFEIKD